MNGPSHQHQRPSRRGLALIWFVVLASVGLVGVAFVVDVGRIVLIRSRLQVSADSAAMAGASLMDRPRNEMRAAAKKHAARTSTGTGTVRLRGADVEYGVWDAARRSFSPLPGRGNAVRVTSRVDESGDRPTRLFFAWMFDRCSFTAKASAVAVAVPRDMAFVVDLSGVMNDDTEPCWATEEINDAFASKNGLPAGDAFMQQLYDDFGFGSFSDQQCQYVGSRWAVEQDKWAYARLTEDGGPLTGEDIAPLYRIRSGDDQRTRKRKAYSAIIDEQIARIMPSAKPRPDSSLHYAYWEKYLDYVIYPVSTPTRGRLPPGQDSDRIDRFGNARNRASARIGGHAPERFRNRIGYRTYVQFMMDHGRDSRPAGNRYVPLSRHSADCPRHLESTAGGTFSFPPREQPTHAVRRALIAALQNVKQRNASISDPNQRDWVSIITFDRLTGGGPVVAQPLTADYHEAMQACTLLQAVGDKNPSTATEAGLIAAGEHLRPSSSGGQGRLRANKIVVLITGGAPNLYVSSPDEINLSIGENQGNDFYENGNYAFDAPLVQAMRMKAQGWRVFSVGVGRETDHDFLDRLSRAGGTAGGGRSSRGSGSPAEYEQRLVERLKEIIEDPKVRLVQ